MDRKEEIIKSALFLASKNGLSNITMSQIAKEVGIQKPSLYNHFKSKEELIDEMYNFLKEKSKEITLGNFDYENLIKNNSLQDILTTTVNNYFKICTQSDMFLFYKVIYSERTFNKTATKILIEETNKMILATKNLFYALKAHDKIMTNNIDMLATSYALTIHSLIDNKIDYLTLDKENNNLLENYIIWFSKEYGNHQ